MALHRASTIAPDLERLRPPRALNVVRDPKANEVGARIDWSRWYLTDEDDMGEGCEQGAIIRTAVSSLEQWGRTRGWQNVYIAGDQFFAWIREEPLVRVSPDVYLLDDPPPPPLPASWKTWLPGHRPPRFALEIVSDDWRKDYDDNPPKYAQLGARELVIFDPEAVLRPGGHRRRVPLQVYRREADGSFVRVYKGKGPASSQEIQAWLVPRHEAGAVRLRVACDEAGVEIVPTAEEARATAEQARATAEQARATAEQAHEHERQARQAAERELEQLRALVARRPGRKK
jgi:hypothetical protein